MNIYCKGEIEFGRTLSKYALKSLTQITEDCFNIQKDKETTVEIWANDKKYHEDDIKETLTKIAEKFPIRSGTIEYSCDHPEAEDCGSHWCFTFEDDTWQERNGHIAYESEWIYENGTAKCKHCKHMALQNIKSTFCPHCGFKMSKKPIDSMTENIENKKYKNTYLLDITFKNRYDPDIISSTLWLMHTDKDFTEKEIQDIFSETNNMLYDENCKELSICYAYNVYDTTTLTLGFKEYINKNAEKYNDVQIEPCPATINKETFETEKIYTITLD